MATEDREGRGAAHEPGPLSKEVPVEEVRVRSPCRIGGQPRRSAPPEMGGDEKGPHARLIGSETKVTAQDGLSLKAWN